LGSIGGSKFSRGWDWRDDINEHAVGIGHDEVPLTEGLVTQRQHDRHAGSHQSRMVRVDMWLPFVR
jgi:hypothetical protein